MAKFKIYNVSDLVGKLEKISSSERHDQVTRNVHEFFEKKMASNKNTLVSSDDIKNIFSTFASMNSQSNFRDHFPEVFASDESIVAPAQEARFENPFSREEVLADDYRPMAIEYQPNGVEEIKNASLEKVRKIADSTLTFPEYKFAGYTKVENYGNSGFASWTVAFNTGKGTASINVPVVVVDGYAHAPIKFYSASGEGEFSKDGLSDFSKSFRGDRLVASQNSGLKQIGLQSSIQIEANALPGIPGAYDDSEGSENSNVSLSYSVPMNAEFEARIDSVQKNLVDAIDIARQEAISKIRSSDNSANKNLSVNMQISYSGALDFNETDSIPEGGLGDGGACEIPGEIEVEVPGAEMVKETSAPEDFDGVIAFNAVGKSLSGIRVATIPVRVRGKVASAEAFYGDGEVHNLDAKTLSEFLTKEVVEVEKAEEATDDVHAYADAFLTSASYNELRKEMKDSIDKNRTKRANACLYAIANKFGADAAANAMSDYSEWSSAKTQGKTTQITWDNSVDDSYNGTMNTSSIYFN
jgi:hypothetical protein